jgi:hypothetical protein
MEAGETRDVLVGGASGVSEEGERCEGLSEGYWQFGDVDIRFRTQGYEDSSTKLRANAI